MFGFKYGIQFIFGLLSLCCLDLGFPLSEEGEIEAFDEDGMCRVASKVFTLFGDLSRGMSIYSENFKGELTVSSSCPSALALASKSSANFSAALNSFESSSLPVLLDSDRS